MDFDPSEFLAMAMSEDQNSYTAPDLAQPHSSMMVPPRLEGGLQMEEDMQIPVPMFGTLEFPIQGEFIESCEIDETRHTQFSEPSNTSPSQLSPADRSASPHPTGKRIIPASYEETRFRKEFYSGKYERVKLFRLHCTICDIHLGCAPGLTVRQMRTHKLLNVAVCRKCFEFYGDINFPVEDDSEVFCCWCGEGGELFCCASCPKTVCKKCIQRNFGERKVKEIDENDSWNCFICRPADIYPHRTLFWGLQRFSKEMRQRVAFLTKEEKQEHLSKDTSHCCPQGNEGYTAISLPFKYVMSKVPLCLIAGPHQAAVMNQPDAPKPSGYMIQTTNNNATQQTNQNLLRTVIAPTRNIKSLVQNHLNGPLPMMGPSRQQMLNRVAINRPSPYPVSRQINPPSQPPQLARNTGKGQVPRRNEPNRYVPSSEVINLVGSLPSKQSYPPQTDHPEHSICWMEKGVRDVNQTLASIKIKLDQFDVCKKELKKDFTKLTSFSDQLSHNIKIAICNLAKINQDMVDAKKIAIDDHVSSVVSSITASVDITTPSRHVERMIKPPEELEQPAPPTSQAEEDMSEMSGLNAALLCETVLAVEGNKENENGNKHSSSPVKKTHPKPHSMQKARKK